ncbi:MAG: hypothetical protein M1834_006627 [Cirrosporium novae-zelandiae]|nr:MAG: hypothetical protein M1834_006627 [Cirrosporium novae-zelandiae]
MPPNHRKRPTIPTTAALPSILLFPSASPTVFRTLSRLSRPALISLALSWLHENPEVQFTCNPFLHESGQGEDEDYDEVALDGYDTGGFTPAASIEELRDIYRDFEGKKGGKREVLDRMLECDWKNGISLYQIADAESRHLLAHPSVQRWTAVKVVRITAVISEGDDIDGGSTDGVEKGERIFEELETLPRFHGPTFIQNLQREIAPLAKAHCYLHRAKELPLTLLRIYFTDSPYNTQNLLSSTRNSRQASSLESSKTLWAAFPDGTPHIYISSSSTQGRAASGEGQNLKKVVLNALPKAFSHPEGHYELQTTSLSSKSLETLLELRGPGRAHAAAGGWNRFADGTADCSPLDHVLIKRKSIDYGSSEIGEDKENISEGNQQGQVRNRKRGRPGLEQPIIRNAIDEANIKRIKCIANNRFGNSGLVGDGKGLDRLEIRLEEPFPFGRSVAEVDNGDDGSANAALRAGGEEGRSSKRGRRSFLDGLPVDDDQPELEEHGAADNPWKPDVRLTFHGSHIFAGIRQLVESGAVDGEKMPGWMTGECGVSIGAVRHGRIMGMNKGSGL